MRHIVLDEFHITISVSSRVPDKECLRIRRTLNSRAFRTTLNRAVRQVIRRYPSLLKVRSVISR